MLDQQTKRKLDSARQILVGKVPDPKAQVEQITIMRSENKLLRIWQKAFQSWQ